MGNGRKWVLFLTGWLLLGMIAFSQLSCLAAFYYDEHGHRVWRDGHDDGWHRAHGDHWDDDHHDHGQNR